MSKEIVYANEILPVMVELLDIPQSYYEKTVARHKAFGEWMHRKESVVAKFSPEIYPQGSFRYGTVIRPLTAAEEYDLDTVCQVSLSKKRVSQKNVKDLVGHEVKAYAVANGMDEPAREKNRCWRLDYADDVNFHMDILPAVPDQDFQNRLLLLEVAGGVAAGAIAITDRRHPRYAQVCDEWLVNNPKGYALWFEGRMRRTAQLLLESCGAMTIHASVDRLPVYAWKTPLQRAVQILKRHRDVMFKDDPDGKPISMIITTLAGRCYEGEIGLYEALVNIVQKMPMWVRDEAPRIANPVCPDEDFADKWRRDSNLEDNFWAWHAQVQQDLVALPQQLDEGHLRRFLREKFAGDVASDRARMILGAASAASVSRVSAPTVVSIKDPPRPWSIDG